MSEKLLTRNTLDVEYFINLQKAFDTVDHEIILTKLINYGIRGVSNVWFKSYISNGQQYVSINGYDSLE